MTDDLCRCDEHPEFPYLELFGRRQRFGWDTWGDEALNPTGVEIPA